MKLTFHQSTMKILKILIIFYMLLSMAMAKEYPGNKKHFERFNYFDEYHFERGDEKNPFLHCKARERERFIENEKNLRHSPKECNDIRNPDVPVNKEDSLALVALYNSTNGYNWYKDDGWLIDNVSLWYGITINESGRVTGISLSSNNLSGTIPPEIGNLVKLTTLMLSSNQLTQIPPEIGNLVNLTLLNLWNNQLTQIPPEIGNLVNLTDLNLYNNQLTQIPPEIGNLGNLVYLYLGWNQLTQIPSEIGNLVNLTFLILWNNQLTQIPPEIGNLVNLTFLILWNNQLTQIPAEIGNLVNLTYLDLGRNKLSDLPVLSLLHYYFSCHLENNKLDFKDLEDAQFNQETQIYYSPQAQTDLQVEDTNSSEIVLTALTSGTGNQYQWYDLDAVLEGETGKSLTINTSQHGDYYCKITNPSFPYLTLTTIPYSNGTSNLTQGVISSEYDALKTLYENTDGAGWYQKENWLSDTLVTAWHGIEVNGLHVTELVLYNNNLSGNIPSKIGNLTYLEILSLSDNQLEGDIPQAIGNLEKLEELYLNYNQLTQIPQEISNLINLMYLSFHGNQLTQIPQEIGNLTDLESLSLSDNHLQNLPDLTGLNKLLLLDVYNNNLTFEDIEPNISLEYSFQYAPQAKVGTEQFIYPQEGEPVQLSINVGGTANTYQWYKNKKPIEGATGHIYTIPAFHEENDKGIYLCKIRNTIATELTLITEHYYVGMGSYNINLSAEPSDGGIVEGGGTYIEGSTAEVRAVANELFKFLNWQENDTVVTTNSILSFVVDEDRDLVAHFENVTGIIQKSAEDNLIIYPNPVQNTIFIRLKDKNLKNKLSEIRIVNLNGKTVLKEKRKISTSGSSSLDISALPAGLYFVQITGNAKQVHTGKFVKE